MTDAAWEAQYEENETRRNARAREYAARYSGGIDQVRADYRTTRVQRTRLEHELARVKRDEGRYAELVRRAAGIERLHVDTEDADELAAAELAAAARARTPGTFDPFDPFGEDAGEVRR